MASNFYRARDAGGGYKLGHGLELGFIAAGIVATGILVFGYATINEKRNKRMAQGAETEYTSLQLSEKGDRAVTFRYML